MIMNARNLISFLLILITAVTKISLSFVIRQLLKLYSISCERETNNNINHNIACIQCFKTLRVLHTTFNAVHLLKEKEYNNIHIHIIQRPINYIFIITTFFKIKQQTPGMKVKIWNNLERERKLRKSPLHQHQFSLKALFGALPSSCQTEALFPFSLHKFLIQNSRFDISKTLKNYQNKTKLHSSKIQNCRGVTRLFLNLTYERGNQQTNFYK